MSEATRSRQAIRPAQAAKKLAVSLPTLWRYCRLNPDMPKPRKLSPRVTVFDEHELDAFLEGRKAAAV